MSLNRCHHCGEHTLTIRTWVTGHHCATCGRPLAHRTIKLERVISASVRLPGRKKAAPRARRTSNA